MVVVPKGFADWNHFVFTPSPIATWDGTSPVKSTLTVQMSPLLRTVNTIYPCTRLNPSSRHDAVSLVLFTVACFPKPYTARSNRRTITNGGCPSSVPKYARSLYQNRLLMQSVISLLCRRAQFYLCHFRFDGC